MTIEDLEFVVPVRGRFTGPKSDDLDRERLEANLGKLRKAVEDYLADLRISSAKIVSLEVDKLTGGTINVGITVSGLIEAPSDTGWRVSIGDATYPFRYWDGSEVAFALDSVGNLTLTGTIQDTDGNPIIRANGFPRCKISNAADSVANDSEETISFDTEVADTDDFWSISNPTYLEIPFDGQYDLKSTLAWAVNSSGRRYMTVEQDDNSSFSSATVIGRGSTTPISNDRSTVIVADTVDLLAGDFIRVRGYQNGGAGALSCTARIALTYLGPS